MIKLQDIISGVSKWKKKTQTPIISNDTLIFHKMSSFITHAYMLYEYKIKQVEI